MKQILIVFSIFTLLLCSCSFNIDKPDNTDISTTEPALTDFGGLVIPVYENVDVSQLNPNLFSFNENGRMEYLDSSVKTLCGIDVSNHQGEIDWDAVASDGVDYAILRIGYRGYGAKGILGADESFERNYEEAKRAGLKVGVYFYSQAISADEAREEARFVLETLGDRELDYPVAYDWEYVDNDTARTDFMTGEKITACAAAFCEEVENAGREVIIYFNCSIGYFDYDLSVLNDYDFWLAEYNKLPTFFYKYTMWQYSCTGTVEGIDGNVDLNISLVDYSEAVTSYG